MHHRRMAETIRLGDLTVRRMGYGAMRLPGKGVWGEPDDPANARSVLRRVVELGINFIDTAWYYGPLVANRLISEALHPYPRDLVIATKLGAKRLPDKSWVPALRPEELRKGAEDDLRSLRLERLDVVHLRKLPDSGVPLMESLDVLLAMQAEGKIRHIALSNVTADDVESALARTPLVAVQNMLNPASGITADTGESVLDLCTKKNIAYLPYFPLAMGKLAQGTSRVAAIGKKHGASPAQLALAWLLARSPIILPIPGTSSIAHLEENWQARHIALSPEELAAVATSE